MWPAVVIDESLTVDRKGLSKTAGGRSVPVQFFGTHDFARFFILLNLFYIGHIPLSSFIFLMTHLFNLIHGVSLVLLSRVRVKQVISFLRGLISSFHLKCKKPRFIVGLEEAKMYTQCYSIMDSFPLVSALISKRFLYLVLWQVSERAKTSRKNAKAAKWNKCR